MSVRGPARFGRGREGPRFAWVIRHLPVVHTGSNHLPAVRPNEASAGRNRATERAGGGRRAVDDAKTTPRGDPMPDYPVARKERAAAKTSADRPSRIAWAGFVLQPAGFFDRNPALDLLPPAPHGPGHRCA